MLSCVENEKKSFITSGQVLRAPNLLQFFFVLFSLVCCSVMSFCVILTLFGTLGEVYKKKKVKEKSRECHNHKPQPFPDPKRKRMIVTFPGSSIIYIIYFTLGNT